MKRFLTIFSVVVFFNFFSSLVVFGHSTTVVISAVFGGDGNWFHRDYIEIKNISNTPQSLNGLSLMYGSSSGTLNGAISFGNTTLNSGQYYLVLLGPTSGGLPINNFDIQNSQTNMSGTSGKVALVTNSFIAGSCGNTGNACSLSNISPSSIGIIDLVAYGLSNNAEGGITANNGVAMSPAATVIRRGSGCIDTDSNVADLDIVSQPSAPKFSGSPVVPCNNLDITTANIMPYGTKNIPYTTSLVASGGNSPYTFSVSSGLVPTGLTLNPNGNWTGVPTTSGIFNFNVTVTDSTSFVNTFKNIALFSPQNSNAKTESFQITISSPFVSGKLLTQTGRVASYPRVILTDVTTGEIRFARSSAFGHFTFDNCVNGHSYHLDVLSKKYRFNQQSFTLNGDLNNLVLIAQ